MSIIYRKSLKGIDEVAFKSSGLPMRLSSYTQPTYAPAPAPEQSYAPPPPPQNYFPELETIKGNMVRDVSTLLGADAAQVVNKIQACRTKDDLFATMMGVKKIILIYADCNAADKFALRYQALSS